jgi:hypothetical protein
VMDAYLLRKFPPADAATPSGDVTEE